MDFTRWLKKNFPTLVAFRNRFYNYLLHYRFRGWSTEKVFETIYLENHWRDTESKSGTGSNIRNTDSVIKIISTVIVELKIKSILDIPCGDFNWMKKVDLTDVNYLGADIVADVVKDNRRYETEWIKFEQLNILESTFYKVDLIFCRDCLVHFSYEDIQRAIISVKGSGSTYFMATTFPAHKNFDIITGDWRPINLELAPFFFPPPIHIYNEMCFEDERYEDKSLAIWRIADL